MQLVTGIPARSHCPPEEGFLFKQTWEFPCCLIDYKGSMEGIGQVRIDLVDKVLGEGNHVRNQGRDMYRERVSFESQDNVTELQTGVSAKRIE